MVFVGICSGIVTPGISAELVGIEIPVISVGDISVDWVLLFFDFNIAEVDCVLGWKPALVLWFRFWAWFFSVVID